MRPPHRLGHAQASTGRATGHSPPTPTDHRPAPPSDSAWAQAGFDDDLADQCHSRGWTLTDVLDILTADHVSSYPMDWCTTGLHPLEALAAIRDGQAAPQPTDPTTRVGEPPNRQDRPRRET